MQDAVVLVTGGSGFIVLDRLATFGEAAAPRVTAYRAALDSKLGTVYRQRKIFEDSVTRLSETISSYLVAGRSRRRSRYSRTTSRSRRPTASIIRYVGRSLV